MRIITDLFSAAALLRVERDENTCRKDMTPEELVSLGRALEAVERPKARERMTAGLTLRSADRRVGETAHIVGNAALNVHVGPAQRDKLALAQSRRQGNAHHRVQAALLEASQELGRALLVQRHDLRAACAGQLHVPRGVGCDEANGFDACGQVVDAAHVLAEPGTDLDVISLHGPPPVRPRTLQRPRAGTARGARQRAW